MSFLSPQIHLQQLLHLEYRHWLKHHRISTSISYLICKKLMVDANFHLSQYINRVNLIDQFVQQTMNNSSLSLLAQEWLNSIIFNVAALNDQYKQEVSESLSLSSHSNRSEDNKKHNEDVSIQIAQNLQEIWNESMPYLLNMSCIGRIIGLIASKKINNEVQHRNKHEIDYTLLSTINYLCSRIKIKCKYNTKIEELLVYLSNCQCQCVDVNFDDNILASVNNLLFGNQKEHTNNGQKFEIKKFQQKLNNNYNTSLLAIASLIDSNYYNFETSRPLFAECLLNGAQLMEEMIKSMVCSFDKNELFSEQMLEVDRIFQLFINVIEYRHLDVYAHWLSIADKYMDDVKNKKKTNTKQIVTSISNFLYSLPLQHRQFMDILKLIYNELIRNKYNKNVSVDVIKKFLLNRFLLNPHLFQDYSESNINEEQLISIFNKLRLFFHSKKAQSEGISTQAERIQGILTSLVSNSSNDSQKKANQLLNINSRVNNLPRQNKNVIYHLDRALNKDYQNVYVDLMERDPYVRQGSESLRKSQNNSNSSYELSFSFVPNNASKDYISKDYISARSERKNIRLNTEIIQDNANIHTVLDQIKDKNISQANLASPTSQKSRKTVHTEYTENPAKIDNQLGIIQYLVAKRRALGTARKAIEQRKTRKTKQREKWMYYFDKIHQGFQSKRRQIELNAARVRTEIQLI